MVRVTSLDYSTRQDVEESVDAISRISYGGNLRLQFESKESTSFDILVNENHADAPGASSDGNGYGDGPNGLLRSNQACFHAYRDVLLRLRDLALERSHAFTGDFENSELFQQRGAYSWDRSLERDLNYIRDSSTCRHPEPENNSHLCHKHLCRCEFEGVDDESHRYSIETSDSSLYALFRNDENVPLATATTVVLLKKFGKSIGVRWRPGLDQRWACYNYYGKPESYLLPVNEME